MPPEKPRRKAGRITDGQFAAVIRAYLASPDYQRLAPGSRKGYARVLALAERAETLGSLSIHVIRPALVQAFLDGLADRPGLQKNAQAVLGAVQRFALVRDLLPYPIMTGTYCAGSDGGHEPWSDAEVSTAEQHARADLARAVTLMVHTGQRGSDIVRMRWSDIEEQEDPITGLVHTGINVAQQKTGKRLWIPLTAALKQALATWERRPPFFLVLKPDGSPYSRELLSWHWNKERDTNAALASLRARKLVLHGLRATCVVRLRQRRATELQIANMIGMSEPMVARYSRLADQREMALAAVHYLDAGTPRERTRGETPKIRR